MPLLKTPRSKRVGYIHHSLCCPFVFIHRDHAFICVWSFLSIKTPFFICTMWRHILFVSTFTAWDPVPPTAPFGGPFVKLLMHAGTVRCEDGSLWGPIRLPAEIHTDHNPRDWRFLSSHSTSFVTNCACDSLSLTWESTGSGKRLFCTFSEWPIGTRFLGWEVAVWCQVFSDNHQTITTPWSTYTSCAVGHLHPSMDVCVSRHLWSISYFLTVSPF